MLAQRKEGLIPSKGIRQDFKNRWSLSQALKDEENFDRQRLEERIFLTKECGMNHGTNMKVHQQTYVIGELRAQARVEEDMRSER